MPMLLGTLDLLDAEALDDVADLDVLVALDANAAFIALLDGLDVVFEAAQRGNLALEDDRGVAHDANLVIAGDFALGDIATGDVADLRDAEHVANLGDTRIALDDFGSEHADACGVDVLDSLVDDAIQANVDLLMLGRLACARGRDER